MPFNLRVLVAEDEFLVCHAVCQQLESLGCTILATARDGSTAVEKVARLKPDAVILDIGMPRMDGIEACRRIMARSPLPIVMLSAYDDKGRLGEAEAAGAGAYVIKPTSEYQLQKALEKALAKRRKAAPPGKARAAKSKPAT